MIKVIKMKIDLKEEAKWIADELANKDVSIDDIYKEIKSIF